MTNSWMNADGEPIMDGAAWRFEQQLDMDSQADYYADRFYDYDEPEDGECCETGDADIAADGSRTCSWCGNDLPDEDEPWEPEDQWLDSYMEDRLSSMYE